MLSRKKEKLIISVRSYLSHEFEDHPRLRIFKSFIKLLYNRSDKVVVPAHLLKKDLVDKFGLADDKVKIIYNFIDLELAGKLQQENIPPHLETIFRNFPVMINVGRITSPKAQWLLVPVVKQIKKTYPLLKLVILGEGPQKDQLMQAAVNEGLKVYIEGKSATSDLDSYDIFLLGFAKKSLSFSF